MEKIATSQSRHQRKLDTKGCCFLCLSVILDIKTEPEEIDKPRSCSESSVVSLKYLRHYLQIKDASSISSSSGASSSSSSSQALKNVEGGEGEGRDPIEEVDLCKACSEIINEFSKSFSTLEKIQRELHHWLQRIHQQISEALEKPEVVQDYSQRMTSDAENLTQLVLADDLRKEIATKSAKIPCDYTIFDPHRVPFPSEGLLPSSPTTPTHPVKIEIQYQSEEDEFEEDRANSSLSFFDEDDDEEESLYFKSPSKTITASASFSSSITTPEESSMPSVVDDLLQIGGINSSIVSSSPTTTSAAAVKYTKNPETGTFQCNACPRQFKALSSVHKHFDIVHLKKRFFCEECGASFTQNSALKLHKSKNCKGKPTTPRAAYRSTYVLNPSSGKYNCSACDKEFNSKDTTKAHYYSVHLQRQYRCEICNTSVFSSSSALSAHRKTCQEMLGTRLARKAKRESDPNLKVLCEICGKKFHSQSHVLKHHQHVHLNRQDFNCEHCDKHYKSAYMLQQHVETAHLGVIFECEICGKHIKYKQKYKLHLKRCQQKTAAATTAAEPSPPSQQQQEQNQVKTEPETGPLEPEIVEHYLHLDLKVERGILKEEEEAMDME